MKEHILQLIIDAVSQLGIGVSGDQKSKISITYPDPKFGDYATNAALILAKDANKNPQDLAKEIISKIDQLEFESITIAGPGFINFRLKNDALIEQVRSEKAEDRSTEKILVEYFQPNIAKPMHMGLMMTAVIGDSISRMLKFLGYPAESDTHMGDWGTQFGLVILAYKRFGNEQTLQSDPINELNKLYVKINEEAEKNPQLREEAKQEFVKLEKGDSENRALWDKFVNLSLEKFLQIDELMNIQPFDHHWGESFYEDKMPQILDQLKSQGLLQESQGAQIVNLENQGLGVAVVVKSDGGTTYLLRDLATFVYRKSLGFTKQLYVVDVRQTHAFKQLFAILKLMNAMNDNEAVHIDYGFMSFKGQALSTRKGNMILVEDVIEQAKQKVAKIIVEKNPNIGSLPIVVKAVAQGAIKYFILSHNRHSDIEFDWDKALDFEGNSGPYLQYTHARLASILTKAGLRGKFETGVKISQTEREVLFQLTLLQETVAESLRDYLPNLLANYLYNLATLLNRFYHESPVINEPDEAIKNFRLALITEAKKTLAQGLDLLGIDALEEM